MDSLTPTNFYYLWTSASLLRGWWNELSIPSLDERGKHFLVVWGGVLTFFAFVKKTPHLLSFIPLPLKLEAADYFNQWKHNFDEKEAVVPHIPPKLLVIDMPKENPSPIIEKVSSLGLSIKMSPSFKDLSSVPLPSNRDKIYSWIERRKGGEVSYYVQGIINSSAELVVIPVLETWINRYELFGVQKEELHLAYGHKGAPTSRSDNGRDPNQFLAEFYAHKVRTTLKGKERWKLKTRSRDHSYPSARWERWFQDLGLGVEHADAFYNTDPWSWHGYFVEDKVEYVEYKNILDNYRSSIWKCITWIEVIQGLFFTDMGTEGYQAPFPHIFVSLLHLGHKDITAGIKTLLERDPVIRDEDILFWDKKQTVKEYQNSCERVGKRLHSSCKWDKLANTQGIEQTIFIIHKECFFNPTCKGGKAEKGFMREEREKWGHVFGLNFPIDTGKRITLDYHLNLNLFLVLVKDEARAIGVWNNPYSFEGGKRKVSLLRNRETFGKEGVINKWIKINKRLPWKESTLINNSTSNNSGTSSPIRTTPPHSSSGESPSPIDLRGEEGIFPRGVIKHLWTFKVMTQNYGLLIWVWIL